MYNYLKISHSQVKGLGLGCAPNLDLNPVNLPFFLRLIEQENVSVTTQSQSLIIQVLKWISNIEICFTTLKYNSEVVLNIRVKIIENPSVRMRQDEKI